MTFPPSFSRRPSTLSRRQALIAGALAATAVPLAAACTSQPDAPPPPDPLEALATRARTDIALINAVADAHPELVERLGPVGADRQRHLDAIERELSRARTGRVSSLAKPAPASSSGSASASVPAPSRPADAVSAVNHALGTAEKQAAEAVPSLPRHRAALIGSVAASCACLREVLA